MEKIIQMYKFLSLILVLICITAGCTTQISQEEAEYENADNISGDDSGCDYSEYHRTFMAVYPMSQDEGRLCYDSQVNFRELKGEYHPEDIVMSYSIGYMTISPGNMTPLHRQMNRSEYIFVTKGTAEILCDSTTVSIKAGESVILPKTVLQSVKSSGNEELVYITLIAPAYSGKSEITGDKLLNIDVTTNEVPIVIENPKKGIEWDIGSDMMIYSIANPALMPYMNLPFEYSVAYAELLPGGVAEENYLRGSSELICVIEGEIEVYAPGGIPVSVTAGNAAYIPANQSKGYRNSGEKTAKILSITDPAWTPEIWESV